MTKVGDLASSCDGVAGPDGCSGLAIVSRYPFIEVRRPLYVVSGTLTADQHKFDV